MQAWVFDEVLPSIRKHGAYITDDVLLKMRNDGVFAEQLLERLYKEQEKNEVLLDCVVELAPKAEYFDVVLQSDTPVHASIIAKDYAMSAVSFNRLLHDMGVHYRVGRTWVLYQYLADRGYTISKTYNCARGRMTQIHTCWTQRGREYLYNLLKWNGIVPVAERIAD